MILLGLYSGQRLADIAGMRGRTSIFKLAKFGL